MTLDGKKTDYREPCTKFRTPKFYSATKGFKIATAKNGLDTVLLSEDMQLFVAGGLQQKALCITNKAVSFADCLQYTQEEADCRMLFLLAHAALLLCH